MHRFFGQFPLKKGPFSITDIAQVRQISHVLRLHPGEVIGLGDGQGRQGQAVIKAIKKTDIEVDIHEVAEKQAESKIYSRLYMSLLKKENFELVLQKATEAGVGEITPLISERTVKTGTKLERWESIIREAAEQSGRYFIPKLQSPVTLKEALGQIDKKDRNYFFHCGVDIPPKKNTSSNANIFIGPEGGWSDREVELAVHAGCTIASLGSLTLRAETAAIIATYIITNQ